MNMTMPNNLRIPKWVFKEPPDRNDFTGSVKEMHKVLMEWRFKRYYPPATPVYTFDADDDFAPPPSKARKTDWTLDKLLDIMNRHMEDKDGDPEWAWQCHDDDGHISRCCRMVSYQRRDGDWVIMLGLYDTLEACEPK
jgi:hypothetical protein